MADNQPLDAKPAAVARPLRTAIQASPAWVITECIDAFIYDMSDRQFGALMGLLLVLVSWTQVLVENKAGVGLFRDVENDQ